MYSVLYGKTDADFQRIIDQESTPKLENTTQKPISETAPKILDLLTDDPYLTRQALAPILDLTQDGVKYHLNKLQRDGYLKRKEGRKTGRWIVLIKKSTLTHKNPAATSSEMTAVLLSYKGHSPANYKKSFE